MFGDVIHSLTPMQIYVIFPKQQNYFQKYFGFNFYSIAVALMGLDKLSESAAGIVTIVFFVVNIIVMFVTFYVFMRRNRNQA